MDMILPEGDDASCEVNVHPFADPEGEGHPRRVASRPQAQAVPAARGRGVPGVKPRAETCGVRECAVTVCWIAVQFPKGWLPMLAC